MGEEPVEQAVVEEPHKRKKYAPRQGTSCPNCGGNLRTVFCTLNLGGTRAIKNHAGCLKCDTVYRIALVKAPEVMKP
jgi:hypothetical protein